MVYHSEIPSEGSPTACGCALLALNTKVRGPARKAEGEDVVDEALRYFRANVLFRKYDVQGPSDKLLIYLTLYINSCVRKLESCPSPAAAQKALFQHAIENIAVPGEPSFPLGGFFTPPANKDEGELLRNYLKQVREEVGTRLIPLCYTADGKHNKFWMAFAKRKFMNKEL